MGHQAPARTAGECQQCSRLHVQPNHLNLVLHHLVVGLEVELAVGQVWGLDGCWSGRVAREAGQWTHGCCPSLVSRPGVAAC